MNIHETDAQGAGAGGASYTMDTAKTTT